MMIACLDVDYREEEAVAACVVFQDWMDAESAAEYVETLHDIEPYQPGQFYRRELPCLLRVLGKVAEPLSTIIVDGFVWLARDSRPGLGAKLYEALDGSIPVIGVAKSSFAGSAGQEVFRGTSTRPLLVTAVGVELHVAASFVQQMHGAYRIPTLLKRVDSLCRQTNYSKAEGG